MFEKYPQRPDVGVTVEVNPPVEPEKPEPEKKVETEKTVEKKVETEKVDEKKPAQ